MDDFKFTITDEARPYLEVQKGSMCKLKEDREAWDARYTESINNYFRTLSGHLPENCGAVLDVGSGLGGINAILSQRYNNLAVMLLDGVDDKPEVNLHNKTFNSMAAAERFLKLNGVDNFSYMDPNNLPQHPTRTFDLVISAGAWCFHFPPDLYLDAIKSQMAPGCVLITDVRKSRTDWLQELTDAFGPGEPIRDATKFTKWKFINGR